jgi:hypothetical protein
MLSCIWYATTGYPYCIGYPVHKYDKWTPLESLGVGSKSIRIDPRTEFLQAVAIMLPPALLASSRPAAVEPNRTVRPHLGPAGWGRVYSSPSY